jgi:hypothetical protein
LTADEYSEAVATLMRPPLSGFTAARSELMRTLREQGKPDLAKRIGALRKPSVVLWALNQAARVAADDLEAVRAAGDRLRQTQERLLRGERVAGEQMTEVLREQRSAIDALSRRLGMVLTAGEHAASPETLRRISDGLRSASTAEPATWSALRHGGLEAEPDLVGFPTPDVADMQRVTEARADHAADAHRKRLDAATADVRRAEDLEKAALEQEQAARHRREQASEAVRVARTTLSELRDEH